MEPIATVRSATTGAIRVAARARSSLRAERTGAAARINVMERHRRKYEAERAEALAFARVLGAVLWVPFVRKAVLGDYRRRIEAAGDKADKLAYRISRLRNDTAALDRSLARADRLAVLLRKAQKAIGELGPVPKEIEDKAADLDFRVGRLLESGSGEAWVARALDEAETAVALVRDWARFRMRAQAAVAAPSVSRVARKGPARRIYLPIPHSMAAAAKERGALRDEAAPRGTSPWYVTTDSDLSGVRNLLPLAYRGKTTFEFPPIPYKASGQNLWGFFDKDSWNRIRSASYAQSGHRCVICGGRGGFIADKVMEESDRRHGVDCHEVWDWQVEDPATGVGVQKLERLLVVCANCHACFHSGYFTRRARDVGLEDEVRDFIEKRRMLINRVDADQLREDLDRTKTELLRIQGVDKWVIDLEGLGRQQFMADHVPVLRERNAAGVTAAHIAGLAFETDAGESFPARDAREIYEELAGVSAPSMPMA